jgi:hypothetical protein
VTAFALGLGHAADAEARVDGLGLLDDQSILDELANGLAYLAKIKRIHQ